jgi:hypothetical protein
VELLELLAQLDLPAVRDLLVFQDHQARRDRLVHQDLSVHPVQLAGLE